MKAFKHDANFVHQSRKVEKDSGEHGHELTLKPAEWMTRQKEQPIR